MPFEYTENQQSQRYVELRDKFEYITPPSIKEDRECRDIFDKMISDIHKLYEELLDKGIEAEDARYILPNASETKTATDSKATEAEETTAEEGETSTGETTATSELAQATETEATEDTTERSGTTAGEGATAEETDLSKTNTTILLILIFVALAVAIITGGYLLLRQRKGLA